MKKILFRTKTFIHCLAVYIIFSFSTSTQANPKLFPTFYVDFGVGLSTYKSEAVESNDTSVAGGYTLGINAGRENTVEMLVSTETSTTNFSYASSEDKSKIDTNIQDVILRVRWGPVYIGPVFNQMQFVVSRRDVEYLDSMGAGNGLNTGTVFEVGKGNLVFVDVISATTLAVKEAVQDSTSAAVSYGPRTEVQFGGILKLTKRLLDMKISYKQRNYSVTVGDETFNEIQTFTWIGLGLNFSF